MFWPRQGAQPSKLVDDIQFVPLPTRGQECPHHGFPVVAFDVQSVQVESETDVPAVYNIPVAPVPVRTA